MKLTIFLLIIILLDEVCCQHLEAYMLGKALHKVARVKSKKKSKDKKAVKYGIGAVVKAGKGTVQKAIGKPMKVVGLALGPLGIPLKVVGKTLEAKSAVNKVKSGVKTVLKLSRHSTRNAWQG